MSATPLSLPPKSPRSARRPGSSVVLLLIARSKVFSSAIWLVATGLVTALYASAFLLALDRTGESPFSVGDTLAWFWYGIPPARDTVSIPYYWISFLSFIFFSSASVTSPAPCTRSIEEMVSSSARWRHWAVTAASATCVIILHVLVHVLVLSALSLSFGALPSLRPLLDTASSGLLRTAVHAVGPIVPWALPLVVACSLSLAQSAAALFVGKAPAFVALLAYLSLTIASDSPFVLGNYLMLARFDSLFEGGWLSCAGFTIAGAVAACAYVVGWLRTRTWDFLFAEEDRL